MNATYVSKLVTELLTFLEEKQIDGSVKIAVLTAATSTLQRVQESEAVVQAFAAHIAKSYN